MEQAWLSGDGEKGQESNLGLPYYTFGESDPEIAYAYAAANIPLTFDGAPRANIARRQISDSIYEFTASYQIQSNFVQPGQTQRTFTTQGGTAHITNSISRTNYGTNAVDYKGAIGVELKDDGRTVSRIRGVDIISPISEFSLTTQFYKEDVTDLVTDCWERLTGKTNNATYKGRPAGTLLFKGVRGGTKGDEKEEYAFDFAFSRNLSGLTIGSITGINKDGWQYLDIIYAPENPARNAQGMQVIVPKQVIVHTVYYDDDFGDLFIP